MEVTVEFCSGCSQLQQSSGSIRLSHVTRTLPIQMLQTVLVLLLLLIDKGSTNISDIPTINPQGSKEFKDLSNSRYYRYLQMDTSNQHLYIGAMDYLYRVNLNDISQVQNSIKLPSVTNDVQSCESLPQKTSNFDCKNHIRSVVVTSDSIIVCGTGAYAPRDDILNKHDLSIRKAGTSSSGRGKCPYNPNDNATSVYVVNGNPGDIPSIYSGTVLNKQFGDPVIFRPRLVKSNGQQTSSLLRTYAHDEKWLNNPEFVGSFDVGQYVYFFFREAALEYTNCGKATFSRVARVCKNDMGGPSVLEYKWTTYLKARLNCSFSGDFPFYFHEIYDVKRIGNTFYAVLATNNVDGLFGSAVCAFTQTDIEKAFSGTFKEQADSSSLWLPVQESKIPSHRPGQCSNDSTRLPDNVVQFIKARPLMDEAVAHSNSKAGKPLYYKGDIIYNTIAVETFTDGGVTYYVYFLGTGYGQVHKVVQWFEGGHTRNRQVAVWKPFGDKVVTIYKMELHNKRLYIATDDAVVQLSVEQCASYKTCDKCAYDPYCGWHQWDKMCVARTSSNQKSAQNNVAGDNIKKVCSTNTCKKQSKPYVKTVRVSGDPVYFHCDTHCPTDSVVWYQDTQQLNIDYVKYFLSQNHGLTVFNVTAADQATYTCRSATTDVHLAEHDLKMSSCGDNATCLWQEEFRNWCSEFDAYKKQFDNWVCLKDKCLGNDQCMPNAIAGSCPMSP